MSAIITGPWRAPVNISADAKGSIHDDATAQKLGLRGGTVAGSIHMEQYPPVLIGLFGEDWLRHGGVSLFFRTVTLDGEKVRCIVTPEGPKRARVRMENEAGALVNEGTASLGVDENSFLRRRLTEARPAQDLRMLKRVRPGFEAEGPPARITHARLDQHLRGITERLGAYDAASGERVLPPNLAIDVLRAAETKLAPVDGPFVGLYGAIEVQMLNGPLYAERDYLVRGQVLALEESPKTESIWYEATARDAVTGGDVARMVMMSRLMKASSPLWASPA